MNRKVALWLIGGAVLGGLGLAAWANAKAPNRGDITYPIVTGDAGRELITELVEASNLDLDWSTFLVGLSASETQGQFTSNIVRGDVTRYPVHAKASPSATGAAGAAEAAAAVRAYQRAREANRFKGCPWAEADYTWGSGGWWSQLAANAWDAYTGTSLACRHPHYLLHPVDQFVCGLEYARRMKQWSSFQADPSWLSLRVAWGNPSKVGDVARREATRETFRPWLEQQGMSSGDANKWMNAPVSAIPDWVVPDQWAALMSRFNFAPGHTGAF
jgi:hypothetical protein